MPTVTRRQINVKDVKVFCDALGPMKEIINIKDESFELESRPIMLALPKFLWITFEDFSKEGLPCSYESLIQEAVLTYVLGDINTLPLILMGAGKIQKKKEQAQGGASCSEQG